MVLMSRDFWILVVTGVLYRRWNDGDDEVFYVMVTTGFLSGDKRVFSPFGVVIDIHSFSALLSGFKNHS